jgi:hypothetical protein
MNDENLLEEINKKLDIVIKLLAVNAIKNEKFIRQVEILSDFGFQPSFIAQMTAKTANNVRVQLHSLRKKKK